MRAQHTRARGSQDNGVAVAHREPHTVSELQNSAAGQRGLFGKGYTLSEKLQPNRGSIVPR